MLRALHYALAKAHAQQPQWLALRISYGACPPSTLSHLLVLLSPANPGS